METKMSKPGELTRNELHEITDGLKCSNCQRVILEVSSYVCGNILKKPLCLDCDDERQNKIRFTERWLDKLKKLVTKETEMLTKETKTTIDLECDYCGANRIYTNMSIDEVLEDLKENDGVIFENDYHFCNKDCFNAWKEDNVD